MKRTWVEVDLDALTENVRALCRVAAGSQLMAVVKANGYGHGAGEVAEAAVAGGSRWLAVACLEEAWQLREYGLQVPILILSYLSPEEAGPAVEKDISCCVFDEEVARALSRAALRAGRRAKAHVKVDTGMGRLGIPASRAAAFVRRLWSLPGLEVEGIFTHLATADEDDLSFAREQLDRFRAVVSELDREGLHIPYRHAANSAALLRLPPARWNLARPGLAIYGIPPVPGGEQSVPLRPVLSWKARVVQAKEVAPGTAVGYGRTWRAQGGEIVLTLPVGYADGYRRALSNRGEVLVGGKRRPVVGRVSMDHITVALPPGEEVRVGEEVVLLGTQGEESISAWDMARAVDSIPYEVLVGIGTRVPRVYVRGGAVAKVRSPR